MSSSRNVSMSHEDVHGLSDFEAYFVYDDDKKNLTRQSKSNITGHSARKYQKHRKDTAKWIFECQKEFIAYQQHF